MDIVLIQLVQTQYALGRSCQISASGERIYHDAYTIQRVEAQYLADFNFVAGLVPMLLNLVQEVSTLQQNQLNLSVSRT